MSYFTGIDTTDTIPHGLEGTRGRWDELAARLMQADPKSWVVLPVDEVTTRGGAPNASGLIYAAMRKRGMPVRITSDGKTLYIKRKLKGKELLKALEDISEPSLPEMPDGGFNASEEFAKHLKELDAQNG